VKSERQKAKGKKRKAKSGKQKVKSKKQKVAEAVLCSSTSNHALE